MNPDRHTLSIRLLARYTFHMDDVLEAVDRGDGAFAAFVGAADDCYFVVFADRDRADLGMVLVGEVGREEGGGRSERG